MFGANGAYEWRTFRTPGAGGAELADGGSGPVVFGQAAQGRVEAGVERLLQRLRSQTRWLLSVVGEVDQPRDQRPRVRAAQRLLSVQVVEQVADRLLVERHALPVALVPEDAAERLRRWGA